MDELKTEFIERLKEIGGIEYKRGEIHFIRFTAAALIDIYGVGVVPLYMHNFKNNVITFREITKKDIPYFQKRFAQNYYYNVNKDKWFGNDSEEETKFVVKIIKTKLRMKWGAKYERTATSIAG